MPLTKNFRETVKARATRDPAFRAGLYQAAMEEILDGNYATASILLRDFVNATIGFKGLSERTGVPAKSLMRMVGPSGNPTIENLLVILSTLKAESGLELRVEAKPERRRKRPERELVAASV